MKNIDKKLIALSTTLAAILTSSASQNAEACMGKFAPEAEVVPSITSDNDHAAMTRPLQRVAFTQNGRRYWRGIYELVNARPGAKLLMPKSPLSGLNRLVFEWACDPLNESTLDACGNALDRVMPGFDETGRPNAAFVQLELPRQHVSSFDGAPVFGAAPALAKVMKFKLAAQPRGMLEG